MNHDKNQLQTVGICQKLFYFIMKALAAQALKPVTLGSPIPGEPTQSPRLMARYSESSGSIEGPQDPESDASIDIEDGDEGKVKVEIVSGSRIKAPRKVVSIKDEPEIICLSKERKTMSDGQSSGLEREKHRPLRSILKVGSTSHLTNSNVRDCNA